MAQTTERRKKSRRYWFIAVIVLLLVAIAGALITTIRTIEARKNSTSVSFLRQEETNAVVTDSYGIETSELPAVTGLVNDHGPLSVNGIYLVDKNGYPMQLKGISTHGIAWYPEYVNYDTFKFLRDDWGVNLIRLSMYTYESGGYCVGGDQNELLETIENGVEYATDLNMYVIIDWHVLNDQDPNEYLSEAKDFFKEMARKYATNENVIYEICNEPNQVSWDSVKKYADAVIPVIRKYDADAVILVGTPNWSQDVDLVAGNPLKESNQTNVMYSCHYYAATHGSYLRNKVLEALRNGTPVFISEFSICDASGDGTIDYDSAAAWDELIDTYHLSYVYWSMSNKEETTALLLPDCTKLSEWNTNDLTECGLYIRNRISGGSYIDPEDTESESGSGRNSGNGDNLSFSYEIKSYWREGSKYLYRIEGTVTNAGKSTVSEWTTTVTLPEDASLEQEPWGCTVAGNGKLLAITGNDYAESIPGGSSLTFGFIFSSGEKLDTFPVDTQALN